MTIAIIGDQPTSGFDHKTATFVVEGSKILNGMDISRCSALRFRAYIMPISSYPKELKYTCEVFQKLFLKLDGLKPRTKVMRLKKSIF